MTSAGELLGIYSGQSKIPSDATQGAASSRSARVPGQALNRAFTEVVRQVRAAMLADQYLVSGKWLPGGVQPKARPSTEKRSKLSSDVPV